MVKSALSLILSISVCFLFAQSGDVSLANGSFEDTPHKGGESIRGIKGWYDCGASFFPRESPPDIHPVDYWGNKLPPHDGNTYLGLVVRENDTWESISHHLADSYIEEGKCYNFSVAVCRSDEYLSGTRKSRLLQNYTTPAVLRVWGGTDYCGDKQLLGETKPVKSQNWTVFDFIFEAKSNLNYITVEAFYVTPTLFPYNGHILVDNLTDFMLTPCPNELALAKPKTPKKKKTLPHLIVSKEKTKPLGKTPQETKVKKTKPPVIAQRNEQKKILEELDRKTIQEGQIINIKKLFFKADTSNISQESFAVLNEIYQFLLDNKDIKVEIGGHTNGVPKHEYCDKLSENRARAVTNYLIDKGISENRIQYKGYGKRKPIASNKSRSGRKKNQRVEIKILSMG